MAEGTEISPTREAPDGVLTDHHDEARIELSEEGRILVEETADLVVGLPD